MYKIVANWTHVKVYLNSNIFPYNDFKYLNIDFRNKIKNYVLVYGALVDKRA